MRAWLLVAILVLAAGCVGSPSTTSSSDGKSPNPSQSNGASSDTRGANASSSANASLPAIGERMPPSTESFVFTPDHALAPAANASKGSATNIPESANGEAFAASFVQDITLQPWSLPAAKHPFEVTGDVLLTIRFTTDQPAATVTKNFGFPSVGGWFGAADRWAVFFAATDAPDSLDAGKTYVVHAKATMPKGGLFYHEGEAVALYTFLGYAPAPGGTLSYVVGGADPAGFTFTHQHFNVSAPRAQTILEKSGTLPPNPTPSAAQNPQPVDLRLDVPADAVYVVIDAQGAATNGGRYDLDIIARQGASDVASGSGPTAHERIELGPGALAAVGRSLVVHVTSSSPSGGSFSVKATSFS